MLGGLRQKRGPDRYEVEIEGETVGLPMPGSVADVAESEKLVLNSESLEDEDFSGSTLVVLSIEGCRFRRCRFERMVVEDARFGSGLIVSEYEDCAFDGSRFSGTGFGRARFVRCSFRDVKLTGLFGHDAEFIDCVFTGRAEGLVFFGRPHKGLAAIKEEAELIAPHLPADERAALRARIDLAARQKGQDSPDRRVNQFSGNDFAGMEMIDCGFRAGVNLTRQILPVDRDYVLIRDASAAVQSARRDVGSWPHGEDREFALRLLSHLMDEVDDGQTQFLLRASEWRARGRADERLFDLLTAY